MGLVRNRDQAVRILTPAGHLPVRLRPATHVTDEALYEFCGLNRDLRVERTRDGDLVIMSPSGGEAGRRIFSLRVLFGSWAEKDGSGVGFDSSTGFLLPNGAERSPHIAWVKKTRWDALTEVERSRFVPLCPDFVIELRSQTDELCELHAKMAEYIECGASCAWLMDPYRRRAYVFEPGQPVRTLRKRATLSAEPLLPGFALELTRLW